MLQARPPARVIWVRLLQKLTKAVLAVGGAAGSASAPAATKFAVVVVLQDVGSRLVSLGLHRRECEYLMRRAGDLVSNTARLQ